MKIAFTSCFDAVNDDAQKGWDALGQQAPDRIVLLGDSIYMDYGRGHKWDNGEPRGLPLRDFSSLMHESYRRQWAVDSFRRAIAGRTVHAIWDDHDFAWNNSRGGGGFVKNDPESVHPDYRKLSRALFQQFRDTVALAAQPAKDGYPRNPHPDGAVAADGGTIAQTMALGPQLRLHLLDGRSFREPGGRSLLGATQQQMLAAALLPEPGVNLLASGTTLLKDWARYSDLAWLDGLAQTHRILMLTGDIHEPQFLARGRLFEASASALAQPTSFSWLIGKRTQVFGLLDTQPDRLVITLFVKGREKQRHTIRLADWAVQSG